MISGLSLAFIQIFILSATMIGWGYWIAKLAGGKLRSDGADHWLCALSGWALCILVLQNLVYLGLRIAYSGWAVAAIAALGWIGLLRRRGNRADSSPKPKALLLVLSAGLLTIAFQGSGLWKHGAHDYYGTGHQDHANYVALAQFLVEKPFGMRLEQVGLEPWTIKAIDTKDMRIGQSVANAYVAVTSLTDAKSAYGAVSVFSLGLMAVTVAVLLRYFGLPAVPALIAGAWAGTLPIITHTHLDGFFSQAYTLLCFPALICGSHLSARHPRLSILSVGLILAQLLTAYTELYIIGVAFVVGSHLSESILPLRRRVKHSVLSLAISLLCVPAYIPRFYTFIEHQYTIASNALALSDLAPRSGTWYGWSESFLRLNHQPDATLAPRILVLFGFAILGFMILGSISSSTKRRTRLLILLLIPAGILSVLLSAPAFPKYPFAKLLASFSPVFIVLAVLGIRRTGPAIAFCIVPRRIVAWPIRYSLPRAMCSIAIGGLATAAAWSSMSELKPVLDNEGIIALLNSEQSRRIYHILENDEHQTYLLNEPHNILNAWLAYHARHSIVYADIDILGDRPVPSSAFPFRRPPPEKELTIINRYGIKSRAYCSSLPDMLVRNTQGVEGDQNLTFYWIGDYVTIEFHHFAAEPSRFIFSLRCLSGLANPEPSRTVALEGTRDGNSAQQRTFENDARLSFPILLHPGKNIFYFRIIAPTDWIVRIPSDPRKHMVRIQELSLSAAPPAEQQ